MSNLTGTAYQLTEAQALPRGHTFTWYIGGVSGSGAISWSGGTNFSVPALAAPMPGGPSGALTPSIGYDTPTFSWSSVIGAAMYDLNLKDLSTGQTVFDNSTISGTTYTPSTPLLVGHSYSWVVGAEGSAGASGSISWSSSTGFSLTTLTAPSPTGTSGPIQASTGYDTPTFSWSSVPGATHYQLFVADNQNPKVSVIGDPSLGLTVVSGVTFTPTMGLLPGHSYTWYIGAEGAAGPAGAITWSGPTSFTLASLKPPTPISPSGSIPPSEGYLTPTLYLEQRHGSGPVRPVRQGCGHRGTDPEQQQQTGSTFMLATPLTAGHSYIWYIGAEGAIGANGPISWSSGDTFTLATGGG